MQHHVLMYFGMADAGRRVCNSIEFQFSDPLSKLATSRTTCYRINKKQRCDAAIGEASQATTNPDRECANHGSVLEYVDHNDIEKSFTSMTEEPAPINFPEHDMTLEQDFVPI